MAEKNPKYITQRFGLQHDNRTNWSGKLEPTVEEQTLRWLCMSRGSLMKD